MLLFHTRAHTIFKKYERPALEPHAPPHSVGRDSRRVPAVAPVRAALAPERTKDGGIVTAGRRAVIARNAPTSVQICLAPPSSPSRCSRTWSKA